MVRRVGIYVCKMLELEDMGELRDALEVIEWKALFLTV